MPASPNTLESGIDFSLVGTDQKFPLGTTVECNDGRERTYVRAGEALTVGNFVTTDLAEGEFNVEHTDAIGEPVFGYVEVAFSDNEYGWIITGGEVPSGNVGGSVSQGDLLGATATAGRLDTVSATASNPTADELSAIIGLAGGKAVQALEDDTANVASCLIH